MEVWSSNACLCAWRGPHRHLRVKRTYIFIMTTPPTLTQYPNSEYLVDSMHGTQISHHKIKFDTARQVPWHQATDTCFNTVTCADEKIRLLGFLFTFRSSDHGRCSLLLCKQVIESLQPRRIDEFKNTSSLKMRLLLSTVSDMSKYSAPHRTSPTLWAFNVTVIP